MLPLQAGALLGPMAGTGMVTLVPALSGVYGAPVGAVALAITTYMVPFALAQLFSGSIAHNLGGRRTALIGYAIFIAGSLATAAAPTFGLFLLLRFVQGKPSICQCSISLHRFSHPPSRVSPFE